MCVSETKLNAELTRKACTYIAPNWLYDDNLSCAPYGRLMVMWNLDFYQLKKLEETDQFLHYEVLSVETNSSFFSYLCLCPELP